MWLERLAGQSREQSSSPLPNRAFSPVPKKPLQLGPSTLVRRPGLQPRSSSLSVASLCTSTESLPTAARIPDGSALRAQLVGSIANDARDPLKVLENIIGPTKRTNGDDSGAVTRPALPVQEIEFGTLSLEQFVDGSPLSASTLQDSEPLETTLTVKDPENERVRFEDLHSSITECDRVLNSVESYLTSFRSDLAIVSAEIETLQNRSATLNKKLENRRAVDKVLGPEVEASSIPPSVVRKLTEGAIDDAWLKSLQELERRSRLIDTKANEGKTTKVVEDLRPFVNDVSTKVVERIRDYVVAQIKSLRSPSINVQVIQQTGFLKYKDIFTFLAKRQPELAGNLTQAYVHTVRWYYTHNFARYKTALHKIELHATDQTDVIASDSGVKKTGRAAIAHDAFSIGRRAETLQNSHDTALPSFAAEDAKGAHFLEVPFRAFNLALVDNSSAEYSFLTEFFVRQPFQATNQKFNEIFQPTFELGHAMTRQLIEQSYDALGILICIRLTQHFAFEMQRRRVPTVEAYTNATNMLLWPRFQIIVDAHCESIRKATAALPGKPAGSALSLTSSSSAAQTTAPHPLTQRFANFLHGILSLSSEAGDDEPTVNSIGRLRTDLETFLGKLSKGIPETRKRERFLYNNYSLISTIISDTEGKLAENLRDHFADLTESLDTQ